MLRPALTEPYNLARTYSYNGGTTFCRYDNGDLDFSSFPSLVIGITLFEHKVTHKVN